MNGDMIKCPSVNEKMALLLFYLIILQMFKDYINCSLLFNFFNVKFYKISQFQIDEYFKFNFLVFRIILHFIKLYSTIFL